MEYEYDDLETGQIEIMHQQVHDRQSEAGDCDGLRLQHDALAAELVKRGLMHDTEMVCSESEIAGMAPNYRRGFTDDVCENCAFGQLYPYCNLYKADYTTNYVCDSFQYFEVLELEPPHGFLMANGKQTALAAAYAPKIMKAPFLVVSNGEAFGIAEFESEPVQLKTKDFDGEEWQIQHRITPRERRQWWPEAETFYVYRLKAWHAYEGVKLFEDGRVIEEPRLTSRQWQIVSKAKELPKQIILCEDAVSVSEKQEFVINLPEKCKELDRILSATYQTDVKEAREADELIPIYSLALVRNPRMRVSKKNLTAEDGVGTEAEKQEDETMPYRIRERDGEYCVVKVNADDSDGETAGCHGTMEEAEAQLTALNINVVAEEEDAYKPRKRKPMKKESEEKQFDDSEWDGAAANWSDSAAYCADCLIDVNPSGEDKVQALCKLPYRKPGGSNPNRAALRNIAARFDQLQKPGDVSQDAWNSQVRAAANKLIGWWPEAFDTDAPEAIYRAAGKTRPKGEPNFFERLKLAAKSILDIVTLAESEETEPEEEVKLFVNEIGIAQKMVGGQLWHFTYSTNAFRDREGEIFSTKSLERYVTAAKDKNDRGFFNLWHIPGTDFARKEWQEVIGRFLVEAGPYLDDMKGRAAAEFFKRYGAGHPEIAPEGWGCSPEFRYLPEERATGVYENIWITRTSTLPKMAAANIWTETRQLARHKMAYSDDQVKAAMEVFQDEDFVKTLFAEGENKTAELEAAGVAHKGKDEEQSEPEAPQTQEIQLNMEELAAEVGKQFQADLTPLAEAMVTMATDLKEMRNRLDKLEETKRVKDKTETPRFIFNLKRASEDAETIVAEGDKLKDQRPAEARGGNIWDQTFK